MKNCFIIQLIIIICTAFHIQQIEACPTQNNYANDDVELTPFGKKKKKKKQEKITDLIGKRPNQDQPEKANRDQNSAGSNPEQPSHKPEDTKPDSILAEKVKYDKPTFYAKITRKNGWLVGVGKALTEEQASHLEIYYKLSRKNKAGHWTLVETFDGYGNPISPQIKNLYLWEEQILDVSKWAFTSDASGETVYQERAMNTDSSTAYVFTPTKVGEREYMGFYTDRWGLPMNLLKKDSGSPDRVLITRDNRGFDVLIKYIDGNGAPQKNENGAFMTHNEYDDEGNMTLSESLNILGERMIDDWGNCGWKSIYRNGQNVESWYFDAEGLPIRMPMIKESARNVYGYRYEYDDYGRTTATMYIDEMGNPDVDNRGVHMIRSDYNEHGMQVMRAYYDINGNLCNGYLDKIAQINNRFDTEGRITFSEFRDKDNNYVINNDDFCRQEVEYHKNKEIKRITYYIPDDSNLTKLVKATEYTSDGKGNSIIKYYDGSGYIKTDSVDVLQRPILSAWYDMQGNPVENLRDYHKEITTYDDEHNTVTKLWVDKNGKPAKHVFLQDYSMSVVTTDSINHIVKEKQFIEETLINSFEDVLDPKSEKIIQHNELTAYGEAARIGWENRLYYRIKRSIDFNGKQTVYYGQNEFGEPSYIMEQSRNGAFFLRDEINNRYFDEDFNEINIDGFIYRLPRVYCIEVTDTAIAYPLGLKNGDIIVSYGNWTSCDNLKTDINHFYLETILQANVAKNITLLRHHPAEKSSEIIKISLPPGKTSDLGFYPHIICYTKKEAQRLRQTCEQYGISLSQPITESDSTTIWLAIQRKGSPDYTDFYFSPTISNKDPGIILYANTDDEKWSVRKNGGTHVALDNETDTIIEEVVTSDYEVADSDEVVEESVDDNSYTISEKLPFSTRFLKRTLFVTHDLNSLNSLNERYSSKSNLKIVPVKVNQSLMKRIQEFYTLHGSEIPNDYDIDDYRAMNDPNITSRKLIGKWNMIDQISDDLTANLTLELNKHHHQASFSILLTWNDPAGLRVHINAMPKWKLSGVCLELDFDNTDVTCEAEKVEGLTLSEDEQSQINHYVERIKKKIENFTLESIFNNSYFVVTELNKNQMTILDGDTERVFNKVK